LVSFLRRDPPVDFLIQQIEWQRALIQNRIVEAANIEFRA
jgi:hypothetical protein